MEQDCFTWLPVEMVTKILDSFDYKERKSLRVLCSSWLAILNYKLKFRVILTNQNEDWIRKCGYAIDSLTIQNLTKNFFNYSNQDRIPNAPIYIIGKGNSSQVLLDLFKHNCTKIESIVLSNLSLCVLKCENLFKEGPTFKFSKLSALTITLGTVGVSGKSADDQIKSHTESLIPMLKTVIIKTLRSFEIKMLFGNEKTFKRPWMEIIDFVLKHKNSIKELSFAMVGKPGPTIPSKLKISKLNALALTKFRIDFDLPHCKFAEDLCFSIKSLKHLEIVQQFWTDRDNRMDKFQIDNIIRSHNETLKILHCQTVLFELPWLQEFKTLETLHVKSSDFKFLENSPVLQAVKMCSLFTFDTSDDELTNNLVYSLENHLPNVEELDITLFHRFRTFEIFHLDSLLRLTKLRIVRLGRNPRTASFKRFSDKNPRFSFQVEERPSVAENVDGGKNYECVVIKIGP